MAETQNECALFDQKVKEMVTEVFSDPTFELPNSGDYFAFEEYYDDSEDDDSEDEDAEESTQNSVDQKIRDTMRKYNWEQDPEIQKFLEEWRKDHEGSSPPPGSLRHQEEQRQNWAALEEMLADPSVVVRDIPTEPEAYAKFMKSPSIVRGDPMLHMDGMVTRNHIFELSSISR